MGVVIVDMKTGLIEERLNFRGDSAVIRRTRDI
jgi:hypothetical protein